MTIDQVIALLASIGACLAAVAAFLTVRQIAQQREASYRPELALSRAIVAGSPKPMTDSPLPTLWANESESGEPNTALQSFAIPLRNVGLGTAKGVVIGWSFPISKGVEEVNQLAQRTLTPAYFTYKNGALSVKSDSLGQTTSMWINQKTVSVDYVLPAAAQMEPVLLQLPHAYVLLTSALLFLAMKGKEQESFPDIPTLRATMEYYDIGERKHKQIYDITFNIVALMGSGESFNAYLEPRKAI